MHICLLASSRFAATWFAGGHLPRSMSGCIWLAWSARVASAFGEGQQMTPTLYAPNAHTALPDLGRGNNEGNQEDSDDRENPSLNNQGPDSTPASTGSRGRTGRSRMLLSQRCGTASSVHRPAAAML